MLQMSLDWLILPFMEPIQKAHISRKYQRAKALFLGNEGEGLGNRILKKMDQNLAIPQKREFDSLNVSTAGAILIDRIMNGRY